MPVDENAAIRLIKRYGNRKLYDTLLSRYITLDEIARLVRAGNEIRVVDNETGEDLTTITFAQIILEEEKRRSGLISLGIFRDLIQHSEEALSQWRARVEKSVEAIGTMGEKAGRRVQEMMGGASVREPKENTAEGAPEVAESAEAVPHPPARGFFDDLLVSPQRRLESLQRSIDERIRLITAHPTFQHELRRIERSIKKLEERLGRLRRDERGPEPGDGKPLD